MSVRSQKMLILMSVLCLLPSLVQPQMLSLWADEQMTACNIYVLGPYTPFNLYVFLEPGDDGAFGVEYKLTVLPEHFATVQVVSPVVSSIATGTWYGPPGITAPFISCQSDLFWVCNLTMMSPNIDHGYYMLEPHDESDFLGVAICPGDRPLINAYVWNCFGFNETWGANEESSWGAIKELCR